ncbi:hypothetical protein [Mycobacteroides abscessus]|uniref:hypothetical protein n=1 Tax=Mycobacteroides abscessus TaxID=36809 RepID=UPI00092A29B5|nr:hypothetical protein [Mycobacteroides abscessus]SHW32790.1 Uncharacterised protein [Mycobacteroides abscessus subsp. abscessus]SIA07678.1 Uncharacterised protein [Mycobacteroides abscessus subsp. abscessus]SKR56215.1 Uncharacterised protein [Mycobacteroides abscessus subsp. abscessus]
MANANELTAEMTEAIESIIDGWYPTGPIDWHDFLDRLESTLDVDRVCCTIR